MKSVVALLLASASAIKLSDAPPYFNEPTWTEKFPSASGFVQLNACESAGVDGVQCEPSSNMLFATGMNGDEDLGQTIKMKGDTYKYQQSLAQWTPLVVNTAAGQLPECTGTNGPVGVNCVRKACTGTNGPMDGPASSGCIRAEPATIPHYNTDPEAGRPYQTSGDQTPSDQVPAPAPYVGQNSASFAQLVAEDAEEKPAGKKANRPGKTNDEIIPAHPEKVSNLETPIARSHTTFYGQH
jgi:hypothetical protein